MPYVPAVLTKKCARCSKEFVARSYATAIKYRSHQCRKEVAATKHNNVRGKLPRSTGTVGAYSELLACADLIDRGFDVFRAISQSSPCDLIAIWDGNSLRIEVRTAYLTANGEVRCHRNRGEEHRYDVLAMVAPDRTVTYEPPLPELETPTNEEPS